MNNIIWFIDGKFPVSNISINKVIRIAKTLEQSIHIVFDKRIRSTEKWYWPLSQSHSSTLCEFQSKQDEFQAKLVSQLDNKGISHVFYQVDTADYMSTLSSIFDAHEVSCLIIDNQTRASRHPIFQRLAHLSVPILIMTQRLWPQTIEFVAAVDPMHEHASPTDMDNDIVRTTRHWTQQFKSNWVLAHCCYIAPMFLEHKNVMLNIHAEGLAEFARHANIKEWQTKMLNGNPEHALPRYIEKQGVSILVLGLVARNQLKAMWVGSTTMTLLDDPPCDLLLITQSLSGRKK